MNTRSHYALSLIEVVLAIVILGLAVPPLVLQLGAGVRQQSAALVQQNLTQLASERLWEIFADHANPKRGYAYITSAAYPTESKPRGLVGYTRTTAIREVSPSDYLTPQPGSGIKRVRIVVTGPQKRSLTVESLVTDVAGSLVAGAGREVAPATGAGTGADAQRWAGARVARRAAWLAGESETKP